VPEPFGGETDAAIAEGVRIAGRALEAAGYEVEEIEPPMVFESYLAWTELMMTSLAVADRCSSDTRSGRSTFLGTHDDRISARHA